MEQYAEQFGYLGLFVITFLSASLLPLASELFVLAMRALHFNYIWIILVATAGSTLGGVFNYYIGAVGRDFVLAKYVDMEGKAWNRATSWYQRWGPISLFWSWVPIVGDPLTAVAGTFHLPLHIFLFWVTLGKGLRFVVLLGLADQLQNWFA